VSQALNKNKIQLPGLPLSNGELAVQLTSFTESAYPRSLTLNRTKLQRKQRRPCRCCWCELWVSAACCWWWRCAVPIPHLLKQQRQKSCHKESCCVGCNRGKVICACHNGAQTKVHKEAAPQGGEQQQPHPAPLDDTCHSSSDHTAPGTGSVSNTYTF
jgi:hypothetical protein